MPARQLHIIADTALRDDRRLMRKHSASSTVEKHSASSTVDPRIVAIDRRRREAGLSHAEFAGRAGVELRNWYKLTAGQQKPVATTLLKLNAALAGPRPSPKPPAVIAAFHRLVMAIVAQQLGLDRDGVLATDFETQRPQNPAWKAASEVRQIAIYIAAVELQVENTELAAAIGITREAVRKARNRVEDLRDDAERDALIEAVTAMVRP